MQALRGQAGARAVERVVGSRFPVPSRGRNLIPMHTTGTILAGGRARRMGGRPKGLAEVGGRRIVDRVADALREVTDELLLVANAPEADDWLPGVRVVRDLVPEAGALGGIHAALSHARESVIVVAWDMPFVVPGLLAELRALGEAGALAAAPASGGPAAAEPLCAWYAPACRVAAERRLATGDRRAQGLLDDVGARVLPLDRVLAHGDPALLFLNVNDAPSLAHAASAARA
jgi:molybdopterin-guanine dinucleotide biosynthesis protein A